MVYAGSYTTGICVGRMSFFVYHWKCRWYVKNVDFSIDLYGRQSGVFSFTQTWPFNPLFIQKFNYFPGVVLSIIYNAGFFVMSTWIPFLWALIQVLIVVIGSYSTITTIL